MSKNGDNKREQEKTIQERRELTVDKANDIIQRARYNLSLQELKTLAYLISLIKPTDSPEQSYDIKISDFYKIRGINGNSGKNWQILKDTLIKLASPSWYVNERGKTSMFRWIDDAELPTNSIDVQRGWIKVKFHKSVTQYLMGLKEKGSYTQYELIATLAMKSSYSVRLYELLKSHHGYLTAHDKKPSFKKVEKSIDLETLRYQIGSNKVDKDGKLKEQKYKSFREFRRNCLDVAVEEINELTDLKVSYDKITRGRSVTGILFTMQLRNSVESLEIYKNRDAAFNSDQIPGQQSILDYPESWPKKDYEIEFDE